MSRVYGDKFMTDGVVRERCRKFKDGRTDAHTMKGVEDAILSLQTTLFNELTKWLETTVGSP